MPEDRKVKILLVDDRPENLHAMKVTLQPLECVEIFTAQSGNEALALMIEHEFAVVLMDVQMPEMDGFETASLMQNHKDTRNIPIIFVTAISKDEEQVFKGYKAGAVDYLFKPLNHDILLSKVNVFIKLHRQRVECERLQEELQKIKNIEALGVLAGGIAHDFNNLLTAVFGYIDLAKMLCGPESLIHQQLNEAAKAANRAKQLTQLLLTFSRGGVPVKTRTNIAELLQDTTTLLLSGSNIKVHFDLDRSIGQVKVDKGQINQVFQNLLINAKEAMPNGGNLFISADNVTVDNQGKPKLMTDGKYVKITFRDDGPGIAPAIIGKIFDPYFSSKVMGAKKGQGLGLAVSLSIIKKHGGNIHVDSTPGAGATFSVYLPEEEEEASSPEEKTAEPDVMPPQPSPAAPQQRILIMEDEETVAAALRNMLSFLGYEAVVAGNSAEVMALFSQARESGELFAAVILDLTIRGGEGGEKVIDRLREIDTEIKVIVASGHTENRIMSKFKDYGFDGVLNKPFSLDDLAAEIGKVLHPPKTRPPSQGL